MATIKGNVSVIINSTPRLEAEVFGNEWPLHSHAVHSGLDEDDHTHYMTNAAGASRHHTGDVYFDERVMSDSNLRFDDNYRYLHTDGGGDWDQEGIDLSAGPAEWQDLYDAAGGIVSLIAAITMGINSGGGPSGGGNLDYSYHYGAIGTGRSITADEGAVDITVPDAANSAALVLNQNDVTNNPNILEVRGTGPGHSIYMYGGAQDVYGEGALYLRSGGNVNFQPTANMTFSDGHRTGSTFTSYMPFSDSQAEWDAAYTILGGTGSLLALAMSSAAQDLQNVYDVDPAVLIGSGGAISVAILGNDAYEGISILKSSGTGDSTLLRIANNDAESYSIEFTGNYNIINADSNGLTIESDSTFDVVTATTQLFTAGSNFLVDADQVFKVEVGVHGLLRIAHDGVGGTPDIIFGDYNIGTTWTQGYVVLCETTGEALQYQTDFGEVSIFDALHQCLGGGGISEPDEQILWGTGTTVDSDNYLTYEDSAHVLTINGRFNVNNISWGTETTATFASNTITANFSTGKDMQEVEIDAHATTLALTAPAGGAAKDMTLTISTDGGPFNLGSGGDWANVWWDTNGTNLAVTTLAIPAGDRVVLKLMYNGSQWFGWIHEFNPPG
ncbi:MAG: hypothetical protein OQK82_08755 [Candidatus Pacearchaeota archaeon]|nr:hypothetical protein [Candidatus Pacearchaeota archaeon]